MDKMTIVIVAMVVGWFVLLALPRIGGTWRRKDRDEPFADRRPTLRLLPSRRKRQLFAFLAACLLAGGAQAQNRQQEFRENVAALRAEFAELRDSEVMLGAAAKCGVVDEGTASVAVGNIEQMMGDAMMRYGINDLKFAGITPPDHREAMEQGRRNANCGMLGPSQRARLRQAIYMLAYPNHPMFQ